MMADRSNPSYLHIAIVDDLEQDRARLATAVQDYFRRADGESCGIKCFTSAEELLAGFSQGMFDLAFLDIVMDEMNGVDLAKRIREQDKDITLVFLTSSKEYALDAYPAHPFDYLIKPVETDALYRVLDEIIALRGTPETVVSVRVARDILDIPLKNICAVVSQGHTAEIRLADGQVLNSTAPFKELAGTLSVHPCFLVCNRGILVNMDHAVSLIGDDIRMDDGTSYPLRINGRRAVVSQFSQYMVSRMEQQRKLP